VGRDPGLTTLPGVDEFAKRGGTGVLAAGAVTALIAAAVAGADEPAAPASPAAIVAYHDSGEWARDTARQIRRARSFVAAHRGGRPALVLDIDDTALSGYECLRAANFDRSALTQCAHDATLPAIRPTRALYRYARRHRVTVFFVTGRREEMRSASVKNLRARGFEGKLRITMRPDGQRVGTNATYKANARRAIEARGYRIVANVGDQRSDLRGGHALRNFKLPNPMYLTR
jgi:acid phosphatase